MEHTNSAHLTAREGARRRHLQVGYTACAFGALESVRLGELVLRAGTAPGCLLGDVEPGFGSVVGDRAESRLKPILPRYRRGAGGELENHPIALPHDNAGLPHACFHDRP